MAPLLLPIRTLFLALSVVLLLPAARLAAQDARSGQVAFEEHDQQTNASAPERLDDPGAIVPPPPASQYQLASPLLQGNARVTSDARDATGSFGSKLLGGLGGEGVAFLAGAGALLATVSDCSGDFCGLGGAVVGMFTFAATSFLTVPAGVTLAGNGSGGRGTFWGALGGYAVGAAGVTALLAATSRMETSNEWTLALALGLVAPLAGAIIGYDLSARGRSAEPPPRPTVLGSLRPSVTYDARTATGTVSVSGIF